MIQLGKRLSGFLEKLKFLLRWRKYLRKTVSNDIQYTFRSRTYPGSRMRRYRVHVPAGYNLRKPLPLVVVLHGCRQDGLDIEKITGFNDVADEHGFLVAYPFVTSYSGMRFINCWGWWINREIHRGAGEVEDLWQIIEEIKIHHKVDEKRIHVTGLSSGAGMTVALLIAHGDKIASGASVAGVAFNERAEAVRHIFNRRPRNKPVYAIVSAMREALADNPRAIPLQIVHSQNDETVDIQSAKILRDSWAQCFAVDLKRKHNIEQGRTGEADWQKINYQNSAGESLIATCFLTGPGHGWYGGRPGDYSYTEAPNISRIIWDFFKLHPLKKRVR